MLKNSEIKSEFKSKHIKDAELQLNVTKLAGDKIKSSAF